jgi:hypothetical protein
LMVTVPGEVEESGNLRIQIGRQALPYTVLDPPAANADAEERPASQAKKAEQRVAIEIDLLQERINLTELAIHFEVPKPGLVPGSEQAISVPLAAPVPSEQIIETTAKLEIQAPGGYRIAPPETPWHVESGESTGTPLVVSSGGLPKSLSLTVSLPRSPAKAGTLVRRLWLQSCLGRQMRRERAAFLVSTGDGRLPMELPAGASLEDVAVDGRRVAVSAAAEDGFVIPLDSSEVPQERTIEIWYSLPAPQSWMERVPFVTPRIADHHGLEGVYWQLAVASKKHLVAAPAGMTSEMRWTRRGLLWARQPRLEQSALERWIHATPQTPLPDELNRYVFSALGDDNCGNCLLLPRALLLLVVSGMSLVAGLLLIYYPRLRHPAVLFTTGVVLFSAAVLFPDSAVVALQAAWLGVLLAGSAVLLKWMVDARHPDREIVRGAAYASPDSNTVRAATPAEDIPAPAGTTASAEIVDGPVGESIA